VDQKLSILKARTQFVQFGSHRSYRRRVLGGVNDANQLVAMVNNELAKIIIWLKVNKSLDLTNTNFMIFHPKQKKVHINVPLTIENTTIK